MLVVIGSKNEPKRLAVTNAFKKVYAGHDLTVESVLADSKVSSHPTNSQECLDGAINRTKHARILHPGADYYVGIEGGLLELEGRYWEISWIAITNESGVTHTALSAGIELKGKLLKAVLEGQELNIAFETHYGIKNAGQKNGFYGYATDDLITRVDACTDAVIFALAPFKNPRYFS